MINLTFFTETAMGSLELAQSFWYGSFFANTDPYTLINVVASYYCFNIEVYGKFPGTVTISMCKIVGAWSYIVTVIQYTD